MILKQIENKMKMNCFWLHIFCVFLFIEGVIVQVFLNIKLFAFADKYVQMFQLFNFFTIFSHPMHPHQNKNHIILRVLLNSHPIIQPQIQVNNWKII